MLSRFLDPREREVALGDVTELELMGSDAFANMLGLVLRRQLQPWTQWRPWIVLVVVVMPVAWLLASFCNELGGELFPVLVMWSHHRVAYATGIKPSAEAIGFMLRVAALMVGSWSCGFALRVFARATIYSQIVGFSVIFLAVALSVGPTSLVMLLITTSGWVPVVITFLLVLGPACYGVRHGAKFSKMQAQSLVWLTVMVSIVGILAMWVRGWGEASMENWSKGGAPLTLIQLISRGDTWEAVFGHLLAIFVFTSPALYLLAAAASRRRGHSATRSS